MGCDIHLHVEIKIDGIWQHYNHPYVNPDYRLFSKMAGVRLIDGISPISYAKGFPTDASITTKFDRDVWGTDGHSDSWLSASEISKVVHWYENKILETSPSTIFHPPVFGYFFGNLIEELSKYPRDNKKLTDKGLSDVRIVFWFDN